MSLKKPLVLGSNGQIQQIQSGDTLDAAIIETESITLLNGESSDAITIGMPAYISAADTVKKAKADAAGTATAFALCKTASITAATTGEFFTSGQLASSNWAAVTGGTTLTAGSIYYLSNGTAGQITVTPPTTGLLVEVGQAISTTTLQIKIKRPILL